MASNDVLHLRVLELTQGSVGFESSVRLAENVRPWTGIWVVRYAEVCQDVLDSCSGVLTNGEFFIRTSLC